MAFVAPVVVRRVLRRFPAGAAVGDVAGRLVAGGILTDGAGGVVSASVGLGTGSGLGLLGVLGVARLRRAGTRVLLLVVRHDRFEARFSGRGRAGPG